MTVVVEVCLANRCAVCNVICRVFPTGHWLVFQLCRRAINCSVCSSNCSSSSACFFFSSKITMITTCAFLPTIKSFSTTEMRMSTIYWSIFSPKSVEFVEAELVFRRDSLLLRPIRCAKKIIFRMNFVTKQSWISKRNIGRSWPPIELMIIRTIISTFSSLIRRAMTLTKL